MILYELLTGVVPFEGETAVAVAFKQVSADPRPPSELNPAIPLSLDAVVLRALAKDPAARYADADELIAALQLEREILPAQTAMTTVMATDGAPTAPAAPLLAPAAGIDEPPARTPEEERDRRRRILLWSLGALVAIGVVVLAVLLISSKKSVTVPAVTGESEQVALATLRGVGLNPVPSQEASTTVASGRVVSQSPSAGSSGARAPASASWSREGPRASRSRTSPGLRRLGSHRASSARRASSRRRKSSRARRSPAGW